MRHLALGLLFGLLTAGAAPAVAQLTIDEPTIVIDKTKAGSAVMYLYNASNAPARRSLSVRGFSMGRDLPALEAKATLGALADKPGHDVYEAMVPANAALPIRVEVTNFTEAGPATATVLSDGRSIGTITAVRYDVPFAVKLEGTPAERPEIAFQSLPIEPWTRLGNAVKSVFARDGDRPAPGTGPQVARLTVKNDDALTYAVDWEVVVNDIPVQGSATLTKNGSTVILVTPDRKWFRGPTSYLKDDLQDGQLLLRFRPPSLAPSYAQASKALPLRARLRSGSLLRQTAVGTVVVAVLVFLGGLSSLLLRFWIPNRMQGIDLQEQLRVITDRTRGLSASLDSSVRVLVRVQRHRLAELATSRIPFSPDWGATLAECTRRIGTLSRQLDLLEAIDRLTGTVEKLRTNSIAPTAPSLLGDVQGRLATATDKLGTTEPKDADLQAAQAAISEAEALLHVTDKANPTLEAEIVRRFTNVQPASGGIPPGNATMARLARGLRLTAALGAPVPVAGQINVKDYAGLDLTSLRLGLLLKYVRLFEESSNTVQTDLAKPDGPESRFLRSLDVDGWSWFQDAHFVYSQMDQKIYLEEVRARLTAREVDVVASPSSAGPYEPVRFRAWFRSDLVGRCAAREDVICHWTFRHGETPWTEDGWEVWHYFPEDGKYEIEVTFSEKTTGTKVMAGGKAVGLEDSFTVRSQRSRLLGARTRLELVRFTIVFGATLLGLLAGARDQLTKLDLVGGIIAVFLLGFSADTIKNLLTGK